MESTVLLSDAAAEWAPIRSRPLLDPAECDQIWGRIQNLREFWESPEASENFTILGTAAYLKAERSVEPYLEKSQRLNPILEHAFSDLYARLLDTLRVALGEPVRMQPGAALPGFHIWTMIPKNHISPDTPDIGGGHFDLFHSNLPWQDQIELREDSILSFTLPVVVPRLGSWLRIWNLHYSTFEFSDQPEELHRNAESRLHQYQLGRLDFHSGLWSHCLHRPKGQQPEEKRVMLQGHGYRKSGIWWLYW